MPEIARDQTRPVAAVVVDVRYRGARNAPDAIVYLPASTAETAALRVLVSGPITEAQRALLQERTAAVPDAFYPGYRVRRVLPVAKLIDEMSAAERRRSAIAWTVAIGIAALAAFGMYAYSRATVTSLERPLAIRHALGASSVDNARWLGRRIGLVNAGGLAVALAVSFAYWRVMLAASLPASTAALTAAIVASALLLIAAAAAARPIMRSLESVPCPR